MWQDVFDTTVWSTAIRVALRPNRLLSDFIILVQHISLSRYLVRSSRILGRIEEDQGIVIERRGATIFVVHPL
jgi:hypothetical protein